MVEEMHEINQLRCSAQGVANKALPCNCDQSSRLARISLGFSTARPQPGETPQFLTNQAGWPQRLWHNAKGRITGSFHIHGRPDSAEVVVHDSSFNDKESSCSFPYIHFYYLTQGLAWTEWGSLDVSDSTSERYCPNIELSFIQKQL